MVLIIALNMPSSDKLYPENQEYEFRRTVYRPDNGTFDQERF